MRIQKSGEKMPTLKNYKLFISHSWAYGQYYKRLVEFFDEYPYFKWSDFSVPEDDPIHDAPSSKKLYDAIQKQVRPVHCVIILAGVYATYSEWINKEIEIANQYGKPIVAVEPFGAERTSKVVKDNASVTVKWQSKSIVDAIRNYSI